MEVTVRVVEVREECRGIKSFRLRRCDGRPFGRFTAGAHVDVTGPTGVTRQYSLCSPPGELDTVLVAVKREPGSRGGSAALHDAVTVGTELRIGEPRNLFPLAEAAGTHLLVGAGIGVTPLLSMAHELHGRGAPFRLHYFARSRDEAAFVAVLEAGPFADRVELHLGVEPAAVPDAVAKLMVGVDPAAHVYTCGPAPFMDAVRTAALVQLSEEAVHQEHFSAVPTDEPSGAFEIELDTGEVYAVPAGKSIAEVLEENGQPIDTSCREGICGTCVLDVLSGTPDHRDNCLTRREKAAGDRIAACVSRSLGPRLQIALP